jgi:hypothetical protein
MASENDQVSCALKDPVRDVIKLKVLVARFNVVRQEAYDARFDLICQRQSAGFSIDNTMLLWRRYPIPSPKRVKE